LYAPGVAVAEFLIRPERATFLAPGCLIERSGNFKMALCNGVVLVVEDHPLVRMAVLAVLIEAGFEALEASSAAEAIHVLEARSDIRLVFADAEMPGAMDGVELVHYIRNRWPLVKLIVVSGKQRISSEELPAGARFFHKPYRETSVVEAMIGMLSGS
jgi:two-component system, response regulator PdtaR